MNAENKIGRPLKFKTPKKLEQRITEYFESCFETKWEDELQRDEDGNKLKDETGAWVYKPVRKKVLVKPMSITGLAIALDTSRRTLLDYSEKDGYSHSIKAALDFCHNFVEDGMLSGKINPAAAIFNLKNNYGWIDETEQKTKLTFGRTLEDLIDEANDTNGQQNADRIPVVDSGQKGTAGAVPAESSPMLLLEAKNPAQPVVESPAARVEQGS
jgi:hypothetical protein